MLFRTNEAKQDLARSWNRPDRPFFASGACHILAAAFLETYSQSGYRAVYIKPAEGSRGSHLFVSNGKRVFDYHGYSNHDIYLTHYCTKIRRFFPQWQGQFVPLIQSPISEAFCQRYAHRLPSQYPHDPMPRALAFLRRFTAPNPAINEGKAHSHLPHP